MEASAGATPDDTPAPDEQRASGDELQPRPLDPNAIAKEAATPSSVRGEERID